MAPIFSTNKTNDAQAHCSQVNERLTASEYRKALEQPKRGNRGAHGHYDADGVWWASDIEEIHWHTLKRLEQAKQIKGLRRQMPYTLHAEGGGIVGRYVADFVFLDMEDALHIQDVKSDRARDTDLSDWKIKHLETEYNLKVEKVRLKTPRKRRIQPWK